MDQPNLLVCIDLSPASAKVLSVAERLSNSLGAQLILLHVTLPNPDFVGFEVGPQSVRQQIARDLREEHRELDRLREQLQARNIPAKALLLQGAIVDTIITHAERSRSELVILGSHGRSALYQALVGSVAHGVLTRSAVPIVVVPIRG